MRYSSTNLPLGSLRALQLFVLMDPAFLPVLIQANCILVSVVQILYSLLLYCDMCVCCALDVL